MMYIFINNNPQGLKIGDCVVRAISLSTGDSWERTYIGLCLQGFEMADLPNSNAIWATYLKNKGYKKFNLPDKCPNCYTVSDFARDNPTGNFILATGSHAVAVVDGNILDAWDSSKEIPIAVFKKE